MAYYSFEVFAPQPVAITKPMLLLDTGVNVFTAVVDEVDEFIHRLYEEGVTVKKMHQLDEQEANSPTDLLLEGEPLPALRGVDEVES